MFVNTMKMLNACMVQEVIMKMDSANMDIPGCAYTSRQGDVKREITAIFTMADTAATGNQIQTT